MAMAITHFAIGMGATVLLITFLIPWVRYPRLIGLLGGLWAMVPDATKLVDWAWLAWAHDSRLADVFWLHATLDDTLPDTTEVAVVALLFLVVATAVAEYRDYRTLRAIERRLAADASDE